MASLNGLITKSAIWLARAMLSDRVNLPHVMSFTQYNSPKKLANLARVYFEMKTGKVNAKSHPFIMFLEVNNICNLNCRFCLTGKGTKGDRPIRNMNLAEMKKTIEEVGDYLYFIQLYNWGEPLLNKELFDFISFMHERRIFSMVSSNMNFAWDDVAEKVVTSDLDYFIVAIDGFSAETYSKYRIGGDFDLAINNLKTIMEIRKKLGRDKPFVEWQYVVFKHNQHEIEAAEKFADEIGVDYFHPIAGYIEDPEWITTLPKYRNELGRPDSVAACLRPWTHLNIRADGGVAPCCYEYYKKDDFGDIFQEPFDEFWNNELFVTARKVLSAGLVKAPADPYTICHGCVASGLRPSFEKLESDEEQNLT